MLARAVAIATGRPKSSGSPAEALVPVRRARHARTAVCSASSQYSAGRPGAPVACSTGRRQPGNLQIRVLVVGDVMLSGYHVT
jgi:hypothetical protein